jgi:protein gp37
VGCKHGCPYCYARDIATRFYKNFTPTFFTDRLILDDLSNIPKPKIINEDVRDKNVFVCSMADLFGEWVRQEWIDNVLENVEKAKDWNFVFLTKNPKRYLTTDFPKNAWVGATVDCQERLKPTLDVFKELAEKGKKPTVTFISFEPLREEILIDEKIEYLDLIIIGGQSSNTKEPARQPEWLWVEDLVIKARQYDVLVYFKPNLTVRPKELPQG